jgi:hypothetical protein
MCEDDACEDDMWEDGDGEGCGVPIEPATATPPATPANATVRISVESFTVCSLCGVVLKQIRLRGFRR